MPLEKFVKLEKNNLISINKKYTIAEPHVPNTFEKLPKHHYKAISIKGSFMMHKD